MIFDFGLKINTYAEHFGIDNPTQDRSTDTYTYDCPACTARQSTKYHASYQRHALVLDIEDGAPCIIDHLLTVIRVKCESCGKTHAILPCDVIGYRQCSIYIMLAVLSAFITEEEPVTHVAEKFQISYQLVQLIILVWKKHTSRMETLLRVAFGIYPKQGCEQEILEYFKSNIEAALAEYIIHNKWGLFMERRHEPQTGKIFVGKAESGKARSHKVCIAFGG